MKIFYWCPFISRVATPTSVINSIKSLTKYSNQKFECSLINVANEWSNFNEIKKIDNLKIYNLHNTLDFNNLPKGGFLKSRITYFIVFFRSIVKLHFFLKKHEPNFLVVHLLTFIPLILLSIFNYKTKFILRISGLPILNWPRSIFWKHVSSKLYKVLTPTKLTEDLLLKKKIFPKNIISTVYDPIICVNEIMKKKKIKIKNNFLKKDYIISIGRLTKQKNYFFLLRVINSLIKENFKIKILILGDGEEKKKLQNYVDKNKLDKEIYLNGFQDNVYNFLSKSDFFILTSKWEDPGFVILEAMFLRKIVISSDCYNGPIEIIKNNFNGFLFKQNDEQECVNKIKNTYASINNFDKEIKQIKLNALKTTRKFTIFNHYKEFVKHIL